MRKIARVTSRIAVFAMALLAAVMIKPADAKATTFEDIKVYEVKDMTNFDQQIGLSWEIQWDLNKDAGVSKQTRYGKFTLTKDSIVRIKLFTIDEEAFAANDIFRVYSSSAMVSPIVENDIGYGSGDDFLELKAGTYYVECGSETYTDSTSDHKTKVMIGAVAEKDAVKVEQISNKKRTAITVKVNQYFVEQDLLSTKWCEDKVTYVSSWGTEPLDPVNNSFVAKKNGWYTVRLVANSSVGFNKTVEKFVYIKVTGIGAGAKKGVTYKVGNLKYKLVKDGVNGTGTVAVTGLAKNKSSITIPATVKIKNEVYKVVKIDKKAFYKKSKLKKIVIKSKDIKSIGKYAFKGINKKAKIYVPKEKYSKYKKLLNSKTGYQKKTMKLYKK